MGSVIRGLEKLTKVDIDHFNVGTLEIKLARNLRAWFDSTLSMATCVGKVCSKASLDCTKSYIKEFLSEDSIRS